MIMKGCVQWKPFTIGHIYDPQAGLELGIARLVGQRLTY